MHTATISAPVSNRTRRQLSTPPSSGKPNRWLSAAIIAGLLISMIGAAWLNREPGNPNENLAWAPGTAEALDDDVLSRESAQWIADFDPADCTDTSGIFQVEIDYPSMPTTNPQGYGIVGPAQTDDASAAVDQYRAMRSCETLTDAWAYWTDARINEHKRVLNDQNRAELADLQAHFSEKYPKQFMVIMNDLTISPEIKAEWMAREEVGVIGQPIPLEAKLNPDFAVELSDGRIAFPATVVYSFDDPAIHAYGFPIENPSSTVVMIFAMEDGSWKYDDSLALCLVNCENGVGTPLDPAEAAWAQSPESQTCVRQQLLPELNYTNDLTTIPYENRSYTPSEPASPEQSAVVSEAVVAWNACGFQGDDAAMLSYVTPLGSFNMAHLESGGAGNPLNAAPYLRQWDEGSKQLVSKTSTWNQLVVLNEPIRNTTFGMQWAPMISGSAPNNVSVRVTSQGFNPATAIELEDGRVSIFSIPTIALEDRGAVTYEGNYMQQQVAGVSLQQHGDIWLIDEPVMVDSGTLLSKESDGWWWDESFDEPEVPWTQPVSFNECPAEAERNAFDPDNPGGTIYTQEDYDQVSIERSYEIIGPASPEDADAVILRMRETQACGYMGKTWLKYTARFEYENRTTAGRESLEAMADERSEGSDAVSSWYRDELGITYQDLVVYQDLDELTLDGTESTILNRLYNPATAVEFADGRIGVVQSFVRYEPIPDEWNLESAEGARVYMTIFVYQDGEWMVDENLPLCIGDCTNLPDHSSVPGVDPMATPELESPTPTLTHVPMGGDNRG